MRNAAWLCNQFFPKLTAPRDQEKKANLQLPLGGNEKREVCAPYSSFPAQPEDLTVLAQAPGTEEEWAHLGLRAAKQNSAAAAAPDLWHLEETPAQLLREEREERSMCV